jgi:hypothetical protein
MTDTAKPIAQARGRRFDPDWSPLVAFLVAGWLVAVSRRVVLLGRGRMTDTAKLIAQAREFPAGWAEFVLSLADALEASETRRYEDEQMIGRMSEAAAALEAELEAARLALKQIKLIQPLTLKMLREHGVVFDGPLGADPKNFQHVAFSIYSNLCEMDSIARAAFDE